jgi:ERCC4-type nuclease
MVFLNILRDNREQKGWDFEDHPAKVQDETITTGDYTLAEFCEHDEENDTYYPNYAVERKAGQDFVSSVTRDRDRFRDEVKRASDWDSKLLVLIEEPKTLFKRQQGFMRYRDVSPSQLFGTVEKWERYYNVEFKFVGTRQRGMELTFEALSSRLRSVLTSE